MILFKAADGTLINTNLVTHARMYKEANYFAVKFDFGFNARELLFKSREKAEEELADFRRVAENYRNG